MLRPNWVGSGSRQKNAAPGGSGSIFNSFHFELLKSELLIGRYKSLLDHIYSYKLLIGDDTGMSQQQGFLVLLAKKMQPGSEPP